MEKIRETCILVLFLLTAVCRLSEGDRDWWFWELKRTPEKKHAKIQFHKHAASLSATPGLPPAWPGGKSWGGSPASIQSMQTLGNLRRCTLAAKSSVWGRERDSFSAGVKVDLFIHKEYNTEICVPSRPSDGCTKGCSLGILWSRLAIVNWMETMQSLLVPNALL